VYLCRVPREICRKSLFKAVEPSIGQMGALPIPVLRAMMFHLGNELIGSG
jgi:hypothetical protein